ncbi:hypothetical protein [Clostridium ljungdahlii]
MEGTDDKLIQVGRFYQKLNDIIGSNLPLQKYIAPKDFQPI